MYKSLVVIITWVTLISSVVGCTPVVTITPSATLTKPPPTQKPTSTAAPFGDSEGGLITFSSDQDGDFEIWVISADGRYQRKLTDNNARDTSPAWSPDGKQIAFVSNRDGNDEIYVMNADGNDVRRLTNIESSESFPAWSPDGKQISFDSDRDGNWDVYVMASDGSGLNRLTDHPGEDWISSWSPNGDQILFESKRDGNFEIYLMNANGSGQKRLTTNQAHDGFPSWSPDGAQIAFMSQRDGNYEIFLMDADGTNQRQVTHNPAEDSDPAWSPDGKRLAFVSQRGGNDEIYIMDIDGGRVLQLTDNTAQNWSPAWQPPNREISQTNTWIKTFEGPDYGAFFDITLTNDGNILAVGATNHLHVPPYAGDALLMKLTLDGDVLWEKTWGQEGYEQAWDVTQAEDGGYYIFGETDSYGMGDRDFFLLKIDKEGSEEWHQTYGREKREWPYGMLQLRNGDLLIYGFTTSVEGGERNPYVLRVNKNGDAIWEYTAKSPEEELVLGAVETPEGDLVLAVNIAEDGKLVKLDADGNLRWEQRYKLPRWQYASQITQTDDGGFLLAGFSMSPSRQADTWLGHCTSEGGLEWEKSYGNSSFDDYAIALIRLKDGTYLVGGLGNGMVLTHIDEDGNILWQQSLVGSKVYGAKALIELEDGGFLVAGFIQISNGRSYDAIILRTDAEGRVAEKLR